MAPAGSTTGAAELGEDYAAAWDEWEAEDADAWDAVTGDGLGPTNR